MADTPDPQSVGRELVRQYYTMLNERPDCLHRFFSQNSSYVHGGVEKPGEELPPVKGQQAIHQKIMSLGFKDCHAKIRQVDCQETVGGAVVIQVAGELSNNYEPMRRFMQTFVLARQSPKMFYLHNDIFRYQDEVFHDCDNGVVVSDQQDAAVEHELIECEKPVSSEVPQPVPSAIPVSEQKTSVAVNSVAESLENAAGVDFSGQHSVEPPASVVATTVDTQPTVTSDVKTVESSATADKAVEEKKEPEKEQPSSETEQRTQLPVQKPFSWASLAGKGPSSASSSTAQVPAVAKPQATIKPERKADSNATTQSQPQRAPRSNSHRSDQPVITDSNNERKWNQSFEAGDGKGNSGPVIPDNQQLFVGNLPHNAEDKDLVEFFSKFGNVIDVKINRKGMTRDLPNFGFVSFDGADAVSKTLAAKPLLLYGRHRLNVEEKKEQSELFSRPRGGGGGSGGSSGGRGGRGTSSYRGSSYRGGRGGNHFSTTPTVQSGETK